MPRLKPETLAAEAQRAGRSEAEARTMARLAAGDLLELRHLLEGTGDAQRTENFRLFCALMRLSYNDKHLELIGWAEEAAQLSREQQRGFLRDSLRLLRESYLLHAGLGSISGLWGDEAAFCRNFAPFIGNDNIEPLIGGDRDGDGPADPERESDHRLHTLRLERQQDDKQTQVMAKAVLITGGNRGDVRALLRRAAGLIGERIGRIVRSSACYESAPWGFRAEQSFWNQVLEVETPLHPEELLEAVLSVEAELGRDRVQEGLEKASTGNAMPLGRSTWTSSSTTTR